MSRRGKVWLAVGVLAVGVLAYGAGHHFGYQDASYYEHYWYDNGIAAGKEQACYWRCHFCREWYGNGDFEGVNSDGSKRAYRGSTGPPIGLDYRPRVEDQYPGGGQ